MRIAFMAISFRKLEDHRKGYTTSLAGGRGRMATEDEWQQRTNGNEDEWQRHALAAKLPMLGRSRGETQLRPLTAAPVATAG
jgi:hypothetical protein